MFNPSHRNQLQFSLRLGNTIQTVNIPVQHESVPSFHFPYNSAIMSLHLQAICMGAVVEVNTLCSMFPLALQDKGQRDQIIWLVCHDGRWVLHLNSGETPPLQNALGRALDLAAQTGNAEVYHRLIHRVQRLAQTLSSDNILQWGLGSPQLLATEVQNLIFFNFLRGEQRPGRSHPCRLSRYVAALRLTLEEINRLLDEAWGRRPTYFNRPQ